jgi:small subunit ribosomal protein S5
VAENNSNQNKPGGRNSGPGNRGNRGGPPTSYDAEGRELVEKIVFINRSSKVVKGGRRFSFSALVVAGDKNGRVGLGLGKASEVADCIRKGSDLAKRQMVPISLSGNTIPHEVVCIYDGARVILRPASPGTGIIAGKTVRAVVESAGIRDLLTKSLGSKNPANVAKATIDGLSKLRLREEVYALRGLKVRKKDEASEPAAAATATEASATETAATGNE